MVGDPILLGIDQALIHCGYCIGRGETRIFSTEIAYAGSTRSRIQRIKAHITNFVNKYKTTVLIIEHPVHVPGHGTATFYKLSKVAGAIESLTAELNIRFIDDIWPSQVKAALSGYGKATKARMKRAAQHQFTGRETGEHEADAIGVWLAGRVFLKKEGMKK